MIFEDNNDKNTNNQTKSRRNRQTNPTPYTGLGKLPPQACDLEEAILGQLMLEKVIQSVWNSLRPEFFYEPRHQTIYKAIITLKDRKSAIDILTVTAELRGTGQLEMIGGAYYLTSLTDRVASAQNIEFHILVVHQMFLKRELIRMSYQMMNNMYEDTTDPFEQISSLITEISELEKGIFKRTEKAADQLVFEAIEEMNRPKPTGLLGLSTGLRGVDHITKGDQPGQLRVVAARPAMGKTAYMCSEIAACFFNTETGKFKPKEERSPVGCFSLEMRDVQLTFRILSNISEIDNLKIKKNDLTDQEFIRFHEFAEAFGETGVYIDDTPGLSIDEFEAKAAMMVALHGVKKIYIDYLQLMKGDKFKKYANREAEVSDISRRLKICANELGISIIALCQLSRAVESRKFCKPILSDLRESGSIEQDADIVQFLWRPEYYPEVMTELLKPDGNIFLRLFNLKITEYEGLIITIIAKCREEMTGEVPLKFKGKIMRVQDHFLMLDLLTQMANNLFTAIEKEGPEPF